MEVSAYKLDLMTIDEVRFDFTLLDGTVVTVSEEQSAFRAVVDSAQTEFPGVAGWRNRIIKPAFARNETVLYRRDGDAEQ